MLIRRRLAAATATATALLATAALAACSSGSSSTTGALTKLRVAAPATAVAGLSPVLTGPAGWAIERGKAKTVLARYGYAYGGFAGFANGPPAAQALASGSVQLAQIGDAPAILSRGAGQSNRAIIVATSPGLAWIVVGAGRAKTLADLKGKKIGVQFGSDFDHYLRVELARAGLTNKVTLVNMVIADGYAALQNGSIDAYSTISGIGAVWQSKGGITVVDKAAEANPSYHDSSVTLVNAGFLKAHPNIKKAWWAVYQEGLKLIKVDPSAYYAWTAKESGETPAIAKATTYVGYPDAPVTAQSVTAVQATLDFLVSQKLTKRFPVGEWAVQPSSSSSSGS